VLVVDPLEETREVLRTALESRGLHIFAAAEAEQGLALAREHHPDLIVLDLECEGGKAACGELTSIAEETPVVLLGSARRAPGTACPGQFVSKPYHYAPLIRKIEELLAEARQPATRVG
jgi:DNA-binding response OmpR family regulator